MEGKVKVGNSDEESEEEQTHHIHRPGEDLVKYVQVLSRSDEKDGEAFSISFEKVAKQIKWPHTMCLLLIQIGQRDSEGCCDTIRETYGGYDDVKNAIINANELAPGADRKQFRNLRKKPGQTCREGERINQSKFDS